MKFLKQFKLIFIEPFHEVHDVVQCRKIQLLAGLLLLVIVLQLISLGTIVHAPGAIPSYFYIATALNVVGYLLSRTRIYQFGALLWAIVTSMTTFIAVYDGETMGSPEIAFAFLVFSALVPALVVGPMIILSIGAFNVVGVLFFHIGIFELSSAPDLTRVLILNIAATITITGLIYYRSYLEGVRLKNFQQSEESLSAVTRNMQDGLIVILEGKNVFVNESMASMLGYEDPAELLGGSIASVVHPDEVEAVTNRHRSRLAEKAVENRYETIFITKSGEPVPVEVNAALTPWKGEMAGIVTVRDITDRKQTEKELGNIFDLSLDMIGAGNLQGYFSKINSSFKRILGYEDEEFMAKPFVEYVYEGDLEETLAILKEAVAGKKDLYAVNRYKCKDGSLKWIEWNVIANAQENTFYATGRDITDRKQAEEEIKESEERLRGVIDSKMIGILFWDSQGEISDANEVFLNMVGYTRDEVLSKVVRWRDLTPPEYKEQDDRALEEIAAEGVMTPVEKEYIHKDGSRIPIYLGAASLPGPTLNGVAFVLDITARKQAEEQLRRINDQLQISIENMPNAYILWDQDLHVIEWNKAAEEIFGYSKQEMLGKNPVNYIVPKQVRHLVGDALRNLEIGKVADYSEKDNNIRKDGESISCQWFNTPLTDNNGNVFAILTLAQEITERVKMEEALQAASELNERIISESPIGLAIYDSTGQCIAANSSVAEMIGATREQVLSQNYNKIDSWEKGGLFGAAKKSIRLQDKVRHEFDVTTTFGKRAFLDCVFVPFQLHGQQHLLLMLDDISERKSAEQALKESEVMLEKAQQIAQLGHWKVNAGTNEVTGSAGLYNLFGLGRGESLIDNFIEIIHPEDRERAAGLVPQAIETGEGWDTEYRIVRKDGLEKWVHAVGNVIADEHGKVIELIGTVQDITDRKQAEAELARHRHHLEELVEERTKELHDVQDELVRKGRLATLGQLTATVSHELRNPLGAMRPSMFVIHKRSDKKDEKMQQAIERVDRNVARCDRIIDELLDFTRTTEIETQSTNIDAWLNTTLSDITIPKGIKLIYQPGLGELELGIDTSRMRRALINIIDNACQAMTTEDNPDQGKEDATLTIATHLNDGRVEIEVTDTGSGIPDDVLPKIFEPLYSTKTFGVGLGMATIRQIARQHGGDVEIKNTNSEGTTVEMWLPQTIQ